MSWVIVYAVAAAQGALLALALWRRRVNVGSNRVLAVWVGLVAFDLAVRALYLYDPAPETLKLYRFVGLLPFLYGSLFYIYVRTLTAARGFGYRDLVHLAGFGIALLASMDLFLLDAETTRELFQRWQAGWVPARARFFDIALFIYSPGYVIAALVRVRRYRRRLLARHADTDRAPLHWIDAMAVSQIVIWSIALILWLVPVPFVDSRLIYGAVAAWVFVVGYFSLLQAPVREAPEPPAPPARAVDDARFPALAIRLSRLMDEQAVYREPALSISELARLSGYPEYLVSAFINQRFGCNFWEYINRHRVEAARDCLADAQDQRTILDIAYDCGFTSKSTFNSAFKRMLGETPSGYRKRHAS